MSPKLSATARTSGMKRVQNCSMSLFWFERWMSVTASITWRSLSTFVKAKSCRSTSFAGASSAAQKRGNTPSAETSYPDGIVMKTEPLRLSVGSQ